MMSSVRDLHTNQFLKEVVSFYVSVWIAHVHCSVATHIYYLQVYHGPERKARMSYDVDITGPLLLIPKHAFSPELMVGDIGHVRITNSIRWASLATTTSCM